MFFENFNLEKNYGCKVFKNVPIFFSVFGKTLRLRHSRSGLVSVTSEPCEQSLSRDIPPLERCIPFTVYLYSFYTYVTSFTHFTQHLLCIYRARTEYFLIADDAVASEQQTYFRSLFLSLRKITSANRAAKRFPRRRNVLINQGLALKIKELTRETSRKIVRGGYVYQSKLIGRRGLCTAALFPQNDALTKVNLPGLCGLLMK